MSLSIHLAGRGWGLVLPALAAALGGYAIIRPDRLAEGDAARWRRFGIKPGPAGLGTRLYYRVVGLWFLIMAGMVVWGQVRG